MPTQVMEEDLLKSIEEVDARIRSFRKKVRALLADIKAEGQQSPPGENRSGTA